MINWKSQYNTKIKEIDKQHKVLVKLLNEIVDIKVLSSNSNKINEIGNELVAYKSYHFDTEEALMEKYKYPKIDQHKKEHKEFSRKTLEIINRSNGVGFLFVVSLAEYIKEWIIDHLLGTDKEFSEYMLSIGAEETMSDED